ncbi:peptidoglycan-binding protein, partial [Streptomyces sp. SM12]
MHKRRGPRVAVTLFLCTGVLGGVLAASPAAAVPVVPSASTSAEQPAAESVAPLAVVNLGLTTAQARNLQVYLRDLWSYTGAIDGQLGPASWRAMQRSLRSAGYTGAIDGVVGPATVRALQRRLQSYGYDGAID